jgi:hypothetical protein
MAVDVDVEEMVPPFILQTDYGLESALKGSLWLWRSIIHTHSRLMSRSEIEREVYIDLRNG